MSITAVPPCSKCLHGEGASSGMISRSITIPHATCASTTRSSVAWHACCGQPVAMLTTIIHSPQVKNGCNRSRDFISTRIDLLQRPRTVRSFHRSFACSVMQIWQQLGITVHSAVCAPRTTQVCCRADWSEQRSSVVGPGCEAERDVCAFFRRDDVACGACAIACTEAQRARSSYARAAWTHSICE